MPSLVLPSFTDEEAGTGNGDLLENAELVSGRVRAWIRKFGSKTCVLIHCFTGLPYSSMNRPGPMGLWINQIGGIMKDLEEVIDC